MSSLGQQPPELQATTTTSTIVLLLYPSRQNEKRQIVGNSILVVLDFSSQEDIAGPVDDGETLNLQYSRHI